MLSNVDDNIPVDDGQVAASIIIRLGTVAVVDLSGSFVPTFGGILKYFWLSR